ncbi:MAG: hypothetical protein LBM93_04935 [Oscillospiraceae bacterium]|jgi:GTPase SAR1 family protein|nr:hypothetical protein [Oscillospiraceae bacterium]
MNNTHRCPLCTVPLSVDTCGVYFTFTPIRGEKSVSADLDEESKRKFQLLIEGSNNFKEKLDKNMGRFNLNEQERKGLFYQEAIDHSDDDELIWNKVTINRNAENFDADITCNKGAIFGEKSYPACHNCGYPLPKNFFTYKKIFVIGLVGAAGSGKSVYLQSLTRGQCAELNAFAEWNYEFDYLNLNTLGAQQFYIDTANKLNRFNILPPKTTPGFYLPLLLDMSDNTKNEKYLISITDIAGESLMDSTSDDNEYESHREFLKQCDGCLFVVSVDEILFDKNSLSDSNEKYDIPMNSENVLIDNRYTDIIVTLRRLFTFNKNKSFVSFVLTKSDLLKDRKIENCNEFYDEENTLESWPTMNDVENICARVSNFIPKRRRLQFGKIFVGYFAVSATGKEPINEKYGNIDPACTDTKKCEEMVWCVKGGIDPKYVDFPFIWLVEKLLAIDEE